MDCSTKSCAPGRRCRQWRRCDYCARIRQAQIASVAEAGASTSPRVTYAVARSYSQETMNRDRARFLTRLRTATEGGIWTIERGDLTDTLHLNLIMGTSEPVHAASLAKLWPRDADFWANEIKHSEVRNVAAYCGKRSQMPGPERYGGNLYGSYGTWKRPLALAAERGGAVLSAIALEQMLENAGVQKPDSARFVPPVKERPPASRKETKAERSVRKQRNLKDLEKAQQAFNEERRGKAREHYLARLYAIHRREIELNGYVYIPGHGVVTIEDLKKAGLE